MTGCTVCGAGPWRDSHADWCQRVTAALRAEREICVNGHQLTSENTAPDRYTGHRRCLSCPSGVRATGPVKARKVAA